MNIGKWRFPAIITGFALNYGAYFAEIYRSGIVSMDRGHQSVVVTDRKEVNAETFVVLNILIRVRVLVQIPHHCEESGLVTVETAPRMEADVWLSVFLPRGDGK